VLFTQPVPGTWRDHFAQRVPSFDGRIVLEVGCFDAMFLSRIAAKHPTTAFIGLDWKVKPLVDAAERITAGVGTWEGKAPAEPEGLQRRASETARQEPRPPDLRNLALVHGRAQLLRDMFTERELDEVWLFHPDPCDRDVELPNRLFRGEWLCEVRTLLREAGRSTLILKTDHPGYYQWACALLGLPEPAWFTSPDRSAAPKTRWRDLMPRELLPPRDEAIPFDVTLNSTDFWRDEAAQRQLASRAFAGETTLFESRFVRKKEPIYAVELTAR
jgi:tRNA G46 methylase TrmB